MNKYKSFIKNNSGTLLTIAGCIGTIATTVLGIRAGMKIKEENLDVKESILAAVPAVIGCAGSIACVVAGDALNRKQKSELLATCALAGSSYSSYRQEIRKRYGEEVDKEILETVASNPECMYMAPDIPDKVCTWIIDMCDDNIPPIEIQACERDIIHAEYYLNRNYILKSEQSVIDFFTFLGIENIDPRYGNYGWMIDDCQIYFLDFRHTKIDENTFRLTPIFSPWYDYENLNMFGESNSDYPILPFGDAL